MGPMWASFDVSPVGSQHELDSSLPALWALREVRPQFACAELPLAEGAIDRLAWSTPFRWLEFHAGYFVTQIRPSQGLGVRKPPQDPLQDGFGDAQRGVPALIPCA